MASIRILAPRASNKTRRRIPSTTIASGDIPKPSSSNPFDTDPISAKSTTSFDVFDFDAKEVDLFDFKPNPSPARNDHVRHTSEPVIKMDPVAIGNRPAARVPIEEENDDGSKSSSDSDHGLEKTHRGSLSHEDAAANRSQVPDRPPPPRPVARRGRAMSENLDPNREYVQEMDALKMMKDGTSFLKYGHWGVPHFRPFRLSQDNTKIIWSSKNKAKKSTQIDVRSIDRVIVGQCTSKFQRHASPELAKASFSIVYDRYKTLDVVAKNNTEHNCWVQGLAALIQAANNNELEELTELIVGLKMIRTDPAAAAAADGKSPTRRTYTVDRAQRDFQGLMKFYDRLAAKAKSPKLMVSDEFDGVNAKLGPLKAQLDKIGQQIDDNDMTEIDFLLWQASVEIESMNNIMLALKL